jgi:PhzF family phenazine biosynthesis protein
MVETAFFVSKGAHFELKWFTLEVEIDLCGHATLASGHVLFNHLNYPGDEILFQSNSGLLKVRKQGDLLTLDSPASSNISCEDVSDLSDALGAKPLEVCKSRDYLALFKDESTILRIQPDFEKMKKLNSLGIIITAPGDRSDFVSRFFAPSAGVYEDPVTGSAHTMLIPFWAGKIEKEQIARLPGFQKEG